MKKRLIGIKSKKVVHPINQSNSHVYWNMVIIIVAVVLCILLSYINNATNNNSTGQTVQHILNK